MLSRYTCFVLLVSTTLFAESTLPRTGQVKSYNEGGWEVTDGSIKDDGYYQKGKDRVLTRNKGIVNDPFYGLQWQDDETKTKAIDVPEGEESAALYCRRIGLGDFTNWRLPTYKELSTIFLTQWNPYIDTIFQALPPNDGTDSMTYWSNSNLAGTTGSWVIHFKDGVSNSDLNDYYHYVRCVRGTTLPKNQLRSVGNYAIDEKTHLMWEDTPAVRTNLMKWEKAIEYCENLNIEGYKGWRLPNLIELRSIYDVTVRTNSWRDDVALALGLNVYPDLCTNDTGGGVCSFWSSTSVGPSSQQYAFTIENGMIGSKNKTDELRVRCVRDRSNPAIITLPAIIHILF